MNVFITSLVGYGGKAARLSIDNGDGCKVEWKWGDEESNVWNLSKRRMHDNNVVRGLDG
jgi:hypothetical protein